MNGQPFLTIFHALLKTCVSCVETLKIYERWQWTLSFGVCCLCIRLGPSAQCQTVSVSPACMPSKRTEHLNSRINVCGSFVCLQFTSFLFPCARMERLMNMAEMSWRGDCFHNRTNTPMNITCLLVYVTFLPDTAAGALRIWVAKIPVSVVRTIVFAFNQKKRALFFYLLAHYSVLIIQLLPPTHEHTLNTYSYIYVCGYILTHCNVIPNTEYCYVDVATNEMKWDNLVFMIIISPSLFWADHMCMCASEPCARMISSVRGPYELNGVNDFGQSKVNIRNVKYSMCSSV